MGIFGDGILTKMECPWCSREISVYKATHPYCKYCGGNVIPSKLALKLQKKIKELAGYDVKPFINRLYPGHWQRSEGAWLWFMDTVNDAIMIGSSWTATKIARSNNVSVYHSGSGTIELNDEE